MGVQVCTTLGMLTPEQAKQLREAGLTAYNHNLDTSPEYYSKITSSRKYEVGTALLLCGKQALHAVLCQMSCKLGQGIWRGGCSLDLRLTGGLEL